MIYHIGRLVLSSLCVGALVRLVLGGVHLEFEIGQISRAPFSSCPLFLLQTEL